MVSHHKRHQRICVTNQLIDNYYVLSGILIEKCSFEAACQFNAKAGAIDQVTLGDQPVGYPWSVSVFKAAFPFGQKFEHSASRFLQSTFATRQFEFVVFVSYIILLYFIL